jgi:hypothetical protein
MLPVLHHKFQQIKVIAIISFKSYYWKTSNFVSILIFPTIAILLFFLQHNLRNDTLKKQLLTGSIVAIITLVCVNVIAKNISMDRIFLRLKLYKTSNIQAYQYYLGILLPTVISILVGIGVLGLISYLLNLSDGVKSPLLLFVTILLGILSNCWIGIVVGLFVKDLISCTSYANLITAALLFLGAVYYPISNLPKNIISKVPLLIPQFHISNALLWALDIDANGIGLMYSLAYLIFLSVVSMILLLKIKF